MQPYRYWFYFYGFERFLVTGLTSGSVGQSAIAEISQFIERSEKGLSALWNEKAKGLCAKNLRTGKFCNNFSNASALIFYAKFGSEAQKFSSTERIHDILKKSNFAMPSSDPEYFAHEAQRYWRGSVWLIMNYLIAIGLKEHGKVDLSQRLSRIVWHL